MFLNVKNDYHILPANIQIKVSRRINNSGGRLRNLLEDKKPIEKI